jgi:DNA-binding transcriptional MerR regulator
MPNKATKQRRETWIDLWPAGVSPPTTEDMLSRAELLEELRAQGVNVPESTLIWWESSGVLPRAIRRFRDGRAHALYPTAAVDAIRHLHQLRSAGQPLDRIKPWVDAWVLATTTTWQDPLAPGLASVRGAVNELAQNLRNMRGDINLNSVRVSFADADGREVFATELPLPPPLE